MRLASMIPRLTPPRIIGTDALPTFGSICRLSEEQEGQQQPQPAAGGKEGEGGDGSSQLLSSVSREIPLPNLFNVKNLPRAIFLGEQHHQPKVLSAQLQIIHELFRCCHEAQRNVHVVLEHWSLRDQPYLNKLNEQSADSFDPRAADSPPSSSGLEEDDGDTTSEGFSASHYLTIVKLVRELGGTVWAGFPPRSWARLVSKSEGCAFDEVQRLDQERFEDSSGGKSIIPPLPAQHFSYVENVSWPHRSYLKSMFRPDLRPLVPLEASKTQGPPPREKKGFLAAQALKDTYLAHTVSTILQTDQEGVVLAVAGLGHCEWGFGAPERLQGMLPDQCPFLIMTKPIDATYWQQNSAHSNPPPHLALPEWQTKQADAIVLYEWVD